MTDAATTMDEPAKAGVAAGRVSRRRAWLLFVAVTAGVLAADLVLKAAAFRYVAGEPVVAVEESASDPTFWRRYPHEPVTLVPGVLSLRLTTNTGAVFGLGKGGRWLFVAGSVLAAGVILYFFRQSPARAWPLHMALGMILAGALGNLYDRLVYSCVRDMLYLFPGVELPFGLSWPGGQRELYPWIFNLADAALIVGVLGVLVWTWIAEPRT